MEPTDPTQDVARAFGVDGEQAALVGCLMAKVRSIFGDAVLARPAATQGTAAAQSGDVDAWVAELEDPRCEPQRQQLLCDLLGSYGEGHGLHAKVAELAQRLVRQDAPLALRSAVFRALARARPQALIAEWMKGLADPSPEVRKGAAELLGWAHEPAAMRPLARLVADGDVHTLEVALWAIGEIGVNDAATEAVLVDALLARFCPGPVTDALARMGSLSALGPVLQDVARDPQAVLLAVSRIIERAMPVSLEVDLRREIAALERLQKSHSDDVVRLLATVSLLRLGVQLGAEAIEPFLGDAAS